MPTACTTTNTPTAVTTPWVSGAPRRWRHAATPAPSTRPSERRPAPSSRRPAARVVVGRRRPTADDRRPARRSTAADDARPASQRAGSRSSRSQGHGHGTSPNGDGRPSLPGLRMPRGSSAAFTAPSTSKAGAEGLGHEPGRLSPTPWWWLRLPPCAEHGARARRPRARRRSARLARAAAWPRR